MPKEGCNNTMKLHFTCSWSCCWFGLRALTRHISCRAFFFVEIPKKLLKIIRYNTSYSRVLGDNTNNGLKTKETTFFITYYY